MPLRVPRRTVALIAAPALVSGAVFAAAPLAGAADLPVPTYRGSALALQAKVDLGGTKILDTVLPGGAKFPTGGTGELLRLPGELSNIASLQVLDESSKITKDNTLESKALAASLSVLQGLVGAQLLNADCSADGQQVAGDSQVRGLTLAGTKIPVDLGKPNFAAEIPTELAKLVSGGIYVNEQARTGDGDLQIRALHLKLSVAPDALSSALHSTVPQLRALAERVTGAVEAVTGKTLNQLLGAQQASAGARHGASADTDVRRQASAPKVHPLEAARPAGAAAVARPVAPAAAQASSAAASDSAAAPAAQAGAANSASKSDAASVTRAAQDDSAAADDRALDQRAQRGAKGTVPAPQPAAPDARDSQPAAPQAPAEPAAAQQTPTDPAPSAPAPSDAQPVVTQQSPGASYGVPAAAATKPDQAALSRETVRAAARPGAKSDGGELTVRQRAAAPSSAVPAASVAKGLLGMDIVVSQVTCAGAKIVEAAAPRPPAVLPHTGADGHATRDLGVAGLGLIMAGSAAMGLVRRRRGTSFL